MAAYVDNAIYVFGGYNAAAEVVSEFEKLDFSLTGVENNFDKTPPALSFLRTIQTPLILQRKSSMSSQPLRRCGHHHYK